jgi:hypothetical protein
VFKTAAAASTYSAGQVGIINQLKEVVRRPILSHEDARFDPKVRLADLAQRSKSPHLLKIMLSLISLERQCLANFAKEAALGMICCQNLERMERCGFTVWNEGQRWRYKNKLNVPDSPEGFAFLFPFVLLIATHTTGAATSAEDLSLDFNWSDDLRQMRSFLTEFCKHANPDVRRLAEGYNAMLNFNADAKAHHVFHSAEYLPTLLLVLLHSTLFSNEEALSLFPICTPILFRLMFVEMLDLLLSNKGKVADFNEFSRVIYGPKTAWHALASGAYIEAQNALYRNLHAKLPKAKIEDKSILFAARTLNLLSSQQTSLRDPQDLAQQDPYAHSRSIDRTPKQLVKMQESQASHSATSSATMQEKRQDELQPVQDLRWFDRQPPFRYHGRVRRWFKMGPTDDARLERQRILHAFHKAVDILTLEESYTFRRGEKNRRSYYMVAQFNFQDGTTQRGVVSYGTFKTAAGVETCFHRHLSEKKGDEFLYGKLLQLFTSIDQDEDFIRGGHLNEIISPEEEADGIVERPYIEMDELLGLIKIHDKVNGVVISLFRLPASRLI